MTKVIELLFSYKINKILSVSQGGSMALSEGY